MKMDLLFTTYITPTTMLADLLPARFFVTTHFSAAQFFPTAVSFSQTHLP
jgi:hypothetical protein